MASYFVASAAHGGSDSNAGTIGSPFLTFAHAVSVAITGDSILLNGGDTFTESVVINVQLSSLSSYGTGLATVVTSSSTLITITFTVPPTSVTNLNLQGATSVFNGSTGVNSDIVRVSTSGPTVYNGMTFSGCNFSTGGSYGLRIFHTTSDNGGITGIRVTNNTFNQIGYVGIGFTASSTIGTNFSYSDVVIAGNTISNILGNIGTNAGQAGGYALFVQHVNTTAGAVLFHDNILHDLGANVNPVQQGGGSAFQCEGCTGIQFFNNVAYNIFNTGTTDGGGAYDIDILNINCRVYNNYAFNCDGFGLGCYAIGAAYTGNEFRNNICVNVARNTRYGGLFLSGSSPYLFANNTIIVYGSKPIITIGPALSPTSVLLNNAFIAPAGVPTMIIPSGDSVASMVMDGNYHQSGDGLFLCQNGTGANFTTLSSWHANTGLEAHGVAAGHCYFAEPRPFPMTLTGAAAAFAPALATSPLINAGVDMLGMYGVTPSADFLGNPWTRNSIGAIYNAGTPTAYAATLYALNPMVRWRLAEASGNNGGDSVGTFADLTYANVALGSASIQTGAAPTSAGFNGTSSTAAGVATTHVYALPAFSVLFTIKPAAVNVANQMIVESWNSAFTGNSFNVHLANSTLVFAVADGAGGSVRASFPANFVANSTYTGAVTWSGTTLTCYINGGAGLTPSYSTTTPLSGLPLGMPTIGYYYNNGAPNDFISGLVSEIALVPSVITQAQATALYAAGSVVGYTVTGPKSGLVGGASANFTVTPTSAVTDSVSITSSVGGDTIASSPLSWSSSSTPQTFTVAGSSAGPRTITLSATSGDVVTGSPLAYNAAVPFVVSGPSRVTAGRASTITYTPGAVVTDIITLTDGGSGGTFSPTTLTFSGSSAAQTAQYVPQTSGIITLSGNSVQGAPVTGLVVISNSVQVDAYLDKTGKLFYFGANSTNQTANGAPLQALIKLISTRPTIAVNGQTVQLGGGVSDPSLNFVAWLAQCGSVQSIAMSNAGTASYTLATVTWNNDGGGTGLTLGTPVLASGLIAYTVTNAGSGYTTSFAAPVTGGSYSQRAWVWVKVVANAVAAVTPLTGSALAYGIGYTGSTITGIALPGSSAWTNLNDQWQSSPVAGTGLVVTATVGKYIQSIPVTNGGSGFTAPPTFTITDTGSGAGAVAVPVMSGPLSTDVLTYSTATGWVSTTVGTQTGLSPAPVTNASLTNWAGQLEGPTGLMSGFTAAPTMPVGANLGSTPTYYAYNTFFTGKNKLKASSPWQPGPACLDADFTLDATYYPAIWTPKSWVTSVFYSWTGQQNQFSLMEYTGTWTLQYDDAYYTSGAGSPEFVSLSAAFEGVGGTFSRVINGPHTTLPTATATISGGQVTGLTVGTPGTGLQGVLVTITGGGGSNAAFTAQMSHGSVSGYVQQCPGSGYTSAPTITLTPIAVSGSAVTIQYSASFASLNAGGNMILSINQASAAGVQQVTNPWVFAPGNTIDRSKPFATDDNVVANLTANGNGPGTLRFMGAIGGPINPYTVDASDIMDPNLFSWQLYTTWNGGNPDGPPNSPTFTGTTSASVNPTVVTGIADTSTLVVGQPIVCPGVIPGYVHNIGLNANKQTHIASINSSSQITLTNAAKVSGTFPMSVNPTAAGTVTFTKARRYNTNAADPNYAWNSPRVYSSENWANTGTDSFGQYLDVTHGPQGAGDNGNFLTGGPYGLAYGPVELWSAVPHGLKTGFYIDTFFPQQSFNGTLSSGTPTVTGITGGGSTKLPGQLISGNGIPASTTILSTTSTTLTMSANATASGSQSLTITQAFKWHTTGVVGFLSGSYPIGPLWVTGPNTIVILVGTGGSGGTGQNDYIDGFAQVPIFLPFAVAAPNTSMPYEYCAAMVANWPNTALHLNIPFTASDACLASIAQRVAAHIGPKNMVLIEMGNEPWNSGPDVQCEQVYENAHAALAQYYTPGTSLYPHYKPDRTVTSFTANGSPFIDTHCGSHVVRAANKHYVFCQAWQAAGLDPSRVKLLYNAQYGSPADISSRVSAITAYNLPQDYMAYAAYFGPIANNSQITAACPAGYPGAANPGNWPVDATNSHTRHYVFYGSGFWNAWAAMASCLAGTTLKPMGYEGGLATLIQNIPFSDQAQQDALYHPSFYDVFWCYVLGLHQGNPNVANSGLAYFSYFSLYSNEPINALWKLAESVAQPPGSGTSNKFTTPQGGSPGTGNAMGYYQTNQSPGMLALHDYIGRQQVDTAVATISTTTPRKWFAGLNRRVVGGGR